MTRPVGTLPVGSLTVNVDLDPAPPDPRDADNLGHMVCLRRGYRLGDPHDYRAEDHTGWADLEQHILRDHPGAVLLPLYMMDHSGLSLSTSDAMFRAFDPQRWDWGQVGFVFVSAASIRSEYGRRRISRSLRKRVGDLLRAEVEQYGRYLRGDAYCYSIETADGEVVDSCCGLLGYDHALAEARAAAEALA